MASSLYITDWGEVRISKREADALQLAEMCRRDRCGGPLFQRVYVIEASIIEACRRFAKHKAESV